MVDFLYSLDVQLFYFINHSLANPVFDKFFVFITDVSHWYIAWLILLGILFFQGGKAGKFAAVTALILIAVSDQFSSSFLKNLIARPRPCNVLEGVRLLVTCGGTYSMPSSHALNNFSIAVFFSKLYPKYKWILLTVAFLVAFSRPYIGVHYPSDMIVGMILGSLLGYLFALILLKVENNLLNSTHKS